MPDRRLPTSVSDCLLRPKSPPEGKAFRELVAVVTAASKSFKSGTMFSSVAVPEEVRLPAVQYECQRGAGCQCESSLLI